MRLFGHRINVQHSAVKHGFSALSIAAVLIAHAPALQAQTAPYVLPYTMSTYAGGNPAYTVGLGCGTASVATSLVPGGVALDTAGDGCFASQVNVGADPHDLRVDGMGNIFYLDDTASGGVVHRINPFTLIETIYVGNLLGTKICTPIAPSSKYGDGCTASDGVANSTGLHTLLLKNVRGLGIATNGDLFIAGYGDYFDHKITAATDFMSLVAGTGVTGYSAGTPGNSLVDQSRGITADASGNVWVADTGNNAIREYTLSTNTIGLALNGVNAPPTTQTKGAANGAFSSQFLAGPEDVAFDSNGSLYIADASNNVVRAVYNGKGSLPGITNPVQGQSYVVAGYYAATAPTSAPADYPMNGTAPTMLATSVYLGGPRKISIDSRNNLYIADASYNVVWFVDASTGYIRLIAGSYGQTASYGAAAPAYLCAAHTDNIGDGCPGPQSTIYSTGVNGTAMGISADTQGNLYISDAENSSTAPIYSRIRKVVSGLQFPVYAGTPITQNVQVHLAAGDTPAATNPFTIRGIGSDFTLGAYTCNVQTGDRTDDCILPITFQPTVPGYDTATLTATTAKGAVASFLLSGTGNGTSIAFDPGNNTQLSATINNAQGVALDSAGNAYIADTGNNRVLFYSAATSTTTIFAGTGVSGNTGNGGAATAATLSGPKGVAIDTTGSVYIADTGNNVIRKVSANGIINLYAGAATAVCANPTNGRGDGCPALQATFNSPTGLAADNLGNLYVADTGNNVIRQILSNTNVVTLAGGGTPCTTAQGSTDAIGDGCNANQTVFNAPTGLAFDDTSKNIYVADTGNSDVRKIYLGTTYKTTAAGAVSAIGINPVTLTAGAGQPGTSLNASGLANGSQLSAPTGVAVDAAGNLYIADTGNHAIRMVNAASGIISTIVGIAGTNGTGTLPGTATNTELNTPGGLAVSPLGTITILDSGNNRVITDVRSQISYNFGRTNQGFASPVQNFTELNIGVASATLPSPLFTQSPTNTQFMLIAAANSSGSIAACSSGSLATGAICNVQGQFTPTALGTESVAYTQAGTGSVGAVPTISLTGIGAVLTPTTSTVAQTTPAPPANSQYGGSLTLTTTVTPSSCNTAAPNCYASGTVTFLVDGVGLAPVTLTGSGTSTTTALPATASQQVTGLAVGAHTVSCNYSGDDFYAASTCGDVTITVAQASTTALLAATGSGQAQYPTAGCVLLPTGIEQCTVSQLTTSVTSNTVGTPTGTVTFTATSGTNVTVLGMSSLIGNPATATLPLAYTYSTSGQIISDNTLPPGTYTLTCTYSGAGNFAASACAGIPYVVVAEAPAITIPAPAFTTTWNSGVKPCVPSSLQLNVNGVFITSLGAGCPSITNTNSTGTTGYTSNGTAVVATAQGATSDATIFIIPSNTLTGTLSFSCSGLPADTNCTFSPQTITLAPGTAYSTPIYTDVTLFNDLQPGAVQGVGSLKYPTLGHGRRGVAMAAMLGWPLTLLGLIGILRFRRRSSMHGLSLFALLLILAGSTLTFSGCAGPGDYSPVLTPTGSYPVTFTVTNGTVSTSVVFDYVVNAGIPGFE